jgi:hypothetical protein
MTPEAKKQANEIKARAGDYLRTFGTEAGRRVIKDMRKSFGRYSFDPNPFVMARNEGKREVLLEIEDIIIAGKNPKMIDELFQQPEDESFKF